MPTHLRALIARLVWITHWLTLLSMSRNELAGPSRKAGSMDDCEPLRTTVACETRLVALLRSRWNSSAQRQKLPQRFLLVLLELPLLLLLLW